MTYALGGGKFQAFDTATGLPLVNGKIYTYSAGTLTPVASYPTIDDATAQTNANTNPVILDSRGQATIILAGPTKVILKDSNDVELWTVDNLDAATTGQQGSDVIDANGNYLLRYTTASLAVNYLDIANAASGNNPALSAKGSGTNIDLNLVPKGTGSITISSQKILTPATSSVGSILTLREGTSSGSNIVSLQAPATLAADTAYTLPTAFPTSSGYVLSSTTGGTTSWAATRPFRGIYVTSAGQSLNAGITADVVLTTEVLDADSWWTDVGAGLYQFTPTVAGIYSVSMYVVLTAGSAVQVTGIIAKNGTTQVHSTTSPSSTTATTTVTGLVSLNGSTDYIRLRAKNESGTNGTVSTTTTYAIISLMATT